MRVKKYKASSLPEALKAVKRDLGPNAVIVHSQRIQKGGILGRFGQDTVEVVAAVDSGADEPTKSAAPTANARPASAASAARAIPPAAPPAPQPKPEATPPGRTWESAPDEDDWNRLTTTPDAPPVARLATRARAAAPVSPPRPAAATVGHTAKAPEELATENLAREIAALKATLGRLTQPADTAGIYKLAPSLVTLYQSLVAQEMEPDLAQRLVTAVDRELSDQALSDPQAIDDSLRRHLQRLTPVTGALQPGRQRPLVLFVIGPTGVGKTTTLAKLAANYVFERQRALLVTTDTFRIAAIPQLQTYAEILGIPTAVAYTPADLTQLIEQQTDKDVILVDTPGRSQHHGGRLAELRAFVDAVPRRTVLLAVSASTRFSDMRDIVERFGTVPYDGLLLTKLDETATYGPIVNLVQFSGKPLTYLTTGQNVPADIEVATSERIAWLITEAADG